MGLGMKADNAAAEESREDLAMPGQMPKRSALGQGMCQKVMIVARGRRLRIIAGASAK